VPALGCRFVATKRLFGATTEGDSALFLVAPTINWSFDGSGAPLRYHPDQINSEVS